MKNGTREKFQIKNIVKLNEDLRDYTSLVTIGVLSILYKAISVFPSKQNAVYAICW